MEATEILYGLERERCVFDFGPFIVFRDEDHDGDKKWILQCWINGVKAKAHFEDAREPLELALSEDRAAAFKAITKLHYEQMGQYAPRLAA